MPRKPVYDSSLSLEEEEYEVEEILGKRIKGQDIEYFIKWKDYPLEESTWEPLRNLNNCKESIQDYEEKVRREESNLEKKKRTETYDKLIRSILKKENRSKTQSSSEKRNVSFVEKPPIKKKKIDPNRENHPSTNGSEKILSINSISWVRMIDEKLHAQVHYSNKKTKEDSTAILTTEEIADIDPKKLINFYESKINFMGGKGKTKK